MEKDSALEECMKRIRLLVLDVDGVLTDGGIYMGPDGEAMKRFDIKDGLGIALWHRAGGMTAILTGRSSKIVENRAKERAAERGVIEKADENARKIVSNFIGGLLDPDLYDIIWA